MFQSWRKQSVYSIVVLLQCIIFVVEGNEFQVKVTPESVDVLIGSRLTIQCVANVTTAKQLPGARFLMSDGKTEWETSSDRRVTVKKIIDLVTYVEYLNITWDPVLKEDQYALQGEGNRCQAGNVSASFHVQLKEEYGWMRLFNCHNFKQPLVIGISIMSIALVILSVLIILAIRRRKSSGKYYKMGADSEAVLYPNTKPGHFIY